MVSGFHGGNAWKIYVFIRLLLISLGRMLPCALIVLCGPSWGSYTQLETGHGMPVGGGHLSKRDQNDVDTSVGEHKEVYFFKPEVFMM